jgi:nitroreductase
MDVMEAIRARHSVRIYKPDPVTDDQLAVLLEAARLAPSWTNAQPWELVVVHNPATKARLAETLPPKNPGARAVREAPIVIAAAYREKASGYYKGLAATTLGDYGPFDLGLAMEHVALAAVSIGLATLHVGLLDLGAAEKILGIPEGVRLVELMPVGVADGSAVSPPRKDASAFVHRERYGER